MTHDVDASGSRNCSAAREDDFEERIQIAELRRLRKVFETSSDLCKARWSEEFRDACDGIDALKEAHAKSVYDLEEWYSDADDSVGR